jgi:hypothetical protein
MIGDMVVVWADELVEEVFLIAGGADIVSGDELVDELICSAVVVRSTELLDVPNATAGCVDMEELLPTCLVSTVEFTFVNAPFAALDNGDRDKFAVGINVILRCNKSLLNPTSYSHMQTKLLTA